MTDAIPLAKIRALIASKTGRSQLPPRNDPYWGAAIDRGLFVGYRRLAHGGNWIARWRDDQGKQHYHALGRVDEDDKDAYIAAQKRAREWLKGMQAGVRRKTIVTVSDVCKGYVDDRRKAKGEGTARDAEQRFQRTIYDHPIGAMPIEKVGTKQLQDWLHGLTEPTEKRKGLGRASANRTLTALKAALNLAAKDRSYGIGVEHEREWRDVKAFKKADARRELFLDLTQRRALRAQLSGDLLDLVDAAITTGARPGELGNAKRRQFDARTGTMTFIGKTGTRDVPLPPAALEVFKRVAKGKLPEAPLFANNGSPWTRWEWNQGIQEAASRAELPDGVCMYVLRHSFITEAISGGLSVLEVAKLTGTSLQMINDHYGHLAAGAARDRLALIAMV